MRRADRLIELIGRMKASSISRADDLALALEVSVRTVYRDIVTLQAQGYPIEGEAGVGYRLSAAIDLPPLRFDHDEVDALRLGLAYVREVGDPALAAAAKAALGKVDLARNCGDLPPHDTAVIRAHQRPEHRAPAFLAKLRAALRNRRCLTFAYHGLDGQWSHRTVRPLAVSAFSVGWLLVAWCELRQDFRVFRLDRLSQLVIEDRHFPEEEGRSFADYLDQRVQRSDHA